MNVLTLTDYVKKQKTDPEFVRHYEKRTNHKQYC